MSRRTLALLAVIVAVLGTLVTWGALASSPKSDSTTAAKHPDTDKKGDPDAHGGDPDSDGGGDPDAGKGGETAAIRNAWEWYYGQRTVPGKALPAAALAAARVQAAAIPLYRDGASPDAASWTSVGPTPVDSNNSTYDNGSVARNGWHNVSGRVTAIAVPDGSDQTAYVGGADGGVWKTTNGGTSWTPITDSLPTQAVGALTAVGASTVWLGTGEANTSSDAYYGAGIYRSTDGGTTWKKRGGTIFDQATVYKIVVLSKAVFAATSHGLYRSADAGSTWTRVLAPGGTSDLYGNFVTDLVVLPGTSDKKVVASVGWRGGDPSNGLWLSSDSGKTFSAISPSGFAPQANIGRMSLAVSSGAIYAVVQDAALFNAGSATDGLNGVFRSTTGPNGTWTKIATGTSLLDSNSAISRCYGEHAGVQSWYDQYITVDPTNPNHIVLGLEEIYDSADGGTTWHSIGRYSNACGGTTMTTHPDQHAGAFGVVSGVPTFFAGNDGGVWSQHGATLDNSHWVNLNTNLSITQPYYVAASAGPNPTLIAGTQDNGNVLDNGSTTWPMIRGGDGADVAIVPDTPSTMYAEYVYLTMVKSLDSGAHWSVAAPPDANNSNTARFIAPFEMDPKDSNHLIAVGQHVWEDTTGTTVTWHNVFDNGTGHVGTAVDVRGSTTYEGWCGPCNPAQLDADSPFARGLATNVGGTWHAVAAAGLPNRYISGILIDPANAQHVYVALSGFSRRWIPGGGLGHVFESTDGGATFTDISANLPDAPANDFVLSSGKLVVATDVGVFKRAGDGSWAKLGTGMPTVSVLDMTVPKGTNEIVAATHGRGMWTYGS